MKKRESAANNIILKKHKRVRSQDLVIRDSQGTYCVGLYADDKVRQSADDKLNNPKLCVIRVTCDGDWAYKMSFPMGQKLEIVKKSLFQKFKGKQGYFQSEDKDYNFDYQLQQCMGELRNHRKLVFKEFSENIKEENNLRAYKICECLSVGGFSKVFLLRSKKTGTFFAGKFIDRNFHSDKKFIDLIHNEKEINQSLDYPFIVKMHNFIETKQFFIFIMDYCSSGELFNLMKKHRNMTEGQARFYFIETILAINYIHDKNIIYRDIKPENILLDKNGHIKIADFGLAKVMRGKSNSYCGSLQYMAPQIVKGQPHGFGVDHYCLGSLLFEMMIGCPPYYNPDFSPSETKYHIVNTQVKFPNIRKLSNQLKDLIIRLLEKDQKNRLGSIGGIKQILMHPWIGKFDRKQYEHYNIEPPFEISLAVSNFEKTYLPLQQIEKTYMKIKQEQKNEEDEERVQKKGLRSMDSAKVKNVRNSSKQDKKQASKEINKSQKSVSRSKMRRSTTSNEDNLCNNNNNTKKFGSTSPSLNRRYHFVTPYLSNNRHFSAEQEKNRGSFDKSNSKSLYNTSSIFGSKSRSLTKNNSKPTLNESKKLSAMMGFGQSCKESRNNTLHRKSGKQNELKVKFEQKTSMKKNGGMTFQKVIKIKY